jgi:hypothetical protein
MPTDRAVPALGRAPAGGKIGVGGKHLGDLAPTGGNRIERAHRVLEDHADLPAADVEHRLLGQRDQIAAVQAHLAADDARRRVGQQAHDRQRRQRLAAARFTHQRHRLARRRR